MARRALIERLRRTRRGAPVVRGAARGHVELPDADISIVSDTYVDGSGQETRSVRLGLKVGDEFDVTTGAVDVLELVDALAEAERWREVGP